MINLLTKYNFVKLRNIVFSKKDENFTKDFIEHGRLFKNSRITKENEIENNPNDHLKKEVFKEWNGNSILKNNYKKEAINSLININKLCEKNKIKLIFLFNPIHPKAYKNDKAQIEYRGIKEEIKKRFKNVIIYDFTEYEITKNNLYWFETSHFNTKVGRMMLEQITEINLIKN